MPYPEEMVDAARPEPPSWWPVVGWTFFLGVPGGGVGAPAGRPGAPDPTSPAPYWVAWVLTTGVSAALGAAVALVGVPAVADYREAAITTVVPENLRTGARAGPRDTAGVRTYDCVVETADGRTGSVTVTADGGGTWQLVRRP